MENIEIIFNETTNRPSVPKRIPFMQTPDLPIWEPFDMSSSGIMNSTDFDFEYIQEFDLFFNNSADFAVVDCPFKQYINSFVSKLQCHYGKVGTANLFLLNIFINIEKN